MPRTCKCSGRAGALLRRWLAAAPRCCGPRLPIARARLGALGKPARGPWGAGASARCGCASRPSARAAPPLGRLFPGEPRAARSADNRRWRHGGAGCPRAGRARQLLCTARRGAAGRGANWWTEPLGKRGPAAQSQAGCEPGAGQVPRVWRSAPALIEQGARRDEREVCAPGRLRAQRGKRGPIAGATRAAQAAMADCSTTTHQEHGFACCLEYRVFVGPLRTPPLTAAQQSCNQAQ